MGIICCFRFGDCFRIRLLRLLHPLCQLGEEVLFLALQMLRHRADREFLRPGQLLVILPPVFLFPVLLLPPGHFGNVAQIKFIELADAVGRYITAQAVLLRHLFNVGRLFVDKQGFGGCVLVHILTLAHQCVHGAAALQRQRLANIGLGVLGVVVQNILKEAVGLGPVAILQRHVAPVQQRRDLIIAAAAHDHLFLHNGLLLQGDIFLHVEEDILHSAHLAQISALQGPELLGHILRVQILEAGDQVLALIRLADLQIAAPLVLDPHRVVILKAGTHGQHDFGGVQRGEDIGLVRFAKLALQRDAGEEYAVTLVRQRTVEILRQHGVQGAVTVGGSLLVADENVIGLLVGGNLQNALADPLKLLCLIPVDLLGGDVGIFQRLLQIHIVHHTVIAGAVAGGNFLAGGGVVYVLDAVFTQHQTPVGLRFLGEIGHDGLVDARGLIKLAGSTQPVGPGKERQLLFAVSGRHGLPAAAEFTGGNGAAFNKG